MLQAIEIVITIGIIIAVGYFLAAKGFLDEKAASFMSKLIILFGVPCASIGNMTANFTRESIPEILRGALIMLIAILLMYLMAFLVSKLFKVEKGRKGILIAMMAGANTMFIGYPVCQAIFGNDAGYAFVYDLAHSFLFWSLGVYVISSDRANSEVFNLKSLKKLFSPGFISIIVAVILIALNIKLPGFLSRAVTYFGSLCTPLAVLYAGYVLHKIGFRNLRVSRDMLLVLLGRCIIAPVIVFGLCMLFRFEPVVTKIFVMMSAMPVMNNIPIVGEEYGSDYKFATQCLLASIFVCLLLMPVWMLIFEAIF
ncbi:MAG: AEC family transporter [Clostridia bacterium]|nr:AEC family transporter [Clostridia bacterium]